MNSKQEILPFDGPRYMNNWVVKTNNRENPIEVVSSQLARTEDEVWMFLDGSVAGATEEECTSDVILNITRKKGFFVQLRAGENYNGPFHNEKRAARWARNQLNG